MTYVDKEVDRVRSETYIKLYNFLYARLKKVDRIRVEEVRAMAHSVFDDLYESVVLGSYGVELPNREYVVNQQAERLAQEFVTLLVEQQKSVEKKIKKLTEYEMTERERKPLYELLKGISTNDVGVALRRVSVWRNTGGGVQAAQRRIARFAGSKRGRRAAALAKSEAVRWVEVVQRNLLLAGQVSGVFEQPVYALWVTSGKEKVCKECDYLNGKTVILHKKFTSRSGVAVSTSPLHPQCECRAYYVSAPV